MGKKTPDAPNYQGAADKQLEIGKELIDDQTNANRPTQNTPWGTIEWQQDDDGNWTQNTTLNENLQGALDQQQAMQKWRSEMANGMFGQIGDSMGKPMDWSKFQDFGQAPDAYQNQNLDPSGLPSYGNYGTTAPDMSGNQNFYEGRTQQFGQQDPVAGFDAGNLQNLGSAGDYQGKAEQSIYDRTTARLDPQFEQQQEQLEVSLRNRGLSEGDAAFDSAMSNFNQSKNDAYSSAMNDAITGSGAEASRMHGMDLATREQQFGESDQAYQNRLAQQGMQFGQNNQSWQNNLQQQNQQYQQDAARRAQEYGEKMGLSENEIARMEQQFQQDYAKRNQGFNEQIGYDQANREGQQQSWNQGMGNANYNNQLRQMQIQQEMLKRGMPLNEMNQLMAGMGVQNPQFDGFMGAGTPQVPDYLGAMLGQSNFNQGQAQQGMGGLGSLIGFGGSLLGGMFSDRRLKKNIKKIGELWGYNLYSFTYLWGVDAIGFMADELNPEAVTRLDSGYDYVNLDEVTQCKTRT